MFAKGDRYQQEYRVSDSVYQGFIRSFQDRNPLHTQADYAHEKGFRDVVMHGNILNGFLSHFVGECLPTREVILHTQQIQFTHPVYRNDNLRLVAEVEDYHESVRVAEFRYYFVNQLEQKVARGKLTLGCL